MNNQFKKVGYKKSIRVMADFTSSGLWWGDTAGGCMIDYGELRKLPKSFINNIEQWIMYYDDFCHEHTNYTFVHNIHRARILNYWGFTLAKELKQLYPKYKILYVGETPKGMAKPIEVLE